MANNSTIYNIAAFLIFLIVMIPITSSSAWAASINPPVKMYGEKGIVGFRSPSDTTTIEVSVTHPEDSDISGQVKVLEEPTRSFDCTLLDEASTTSICKNTYPTTELPETIDFIEVTLQVFSDANEPISTPVKGSILVDHEPPVVDHVTFHPKAGGLVEAEYSVSDTACQSPQCANRCSGIDSIAFTIAGTKIGGVDNVTPLCTVGGTVNLTGIVGSGSVETKHVCVEVKDRSGLSSVTCQDVLVDAKPPEITGMQLVDSAGRPVKYSNGQPLGNVRLLINLTEHSQLVNPDNLLQVSSLIKVNASDLTERVDQKEQFGEVVMPCSKVSDNKYTCQSSGLFLIMTSARSLNMKVRAADEWQNKLDESRSLTVNFDNSAPSGIKFSTQWEDDRNQYWMNSTGNNLYLDLQEEGSGFVNGDVFIDIAGIGSQGFGGSVGVLKANDCEPRWKCSWENIADSRGDGSSWTLSTVAGSKDDANNPLPVFSGILFTDVSDPELIALNITAISDTGERADIGSSDALAIHAYIEDYTPIKAYANFSSVLADAGHQRDEGSCSEFTTTDENLSAYIDSIRQNTGKRLFDCYWETSAVVSVPYDIAQPWTNTSIVLTMEDLIGHTSEYEEDVKILGKENATADYWEYEWEGQSPTYGIDRHVWSISQPVSYQHFKLKSRFGQARIISLELDSSSCSGDIDYVFYSETGQAAVELQGFDPEIADGLDDVIVVNLNPANVPPIVVNVTSDVDENGSIVPTAEKKTSSVEVPITELSITCPMRIRSVVGEARISQEEVENITLTVGVYNNPLGQNIGNVREEQDKVERWVKSKAWSWLKWPKKIFKYAGVVCTAMNVIQQLRFIWNTITLGYEAACKITPSVCPAAGQASSKLGGMNKVGEGILSKFTLFCGVAITCRPTSPTAAGAKVKAGDEKKVFKEYKCPDKKSKWCKFFTAWTSWNQKVIQVFSGSAIFGGFGGAEKHAGVTNVYSVTRTNPVSKKTDQVAMGSTIEATSIVDQQALQSSFDPKKSLVTSVLTGCIPGVISGVDKYRQVMCQWLLCYKINVAYGAMTPYQCDELMKFQVCKYVLGEAFNIIPFYQYINMMNQLINDYLKNPLLLAGVAIDLLCSNYCGKGLGLSWSGGCAVCSFMKYASVLTEIAASIFGIVQTFKVKDADLCDEAVKKEPSYGNIPGFPKAEDPAAASDAAKAEAVA